MWDLLFVNLRLATMAGSSRPYGAVGNAAVAVTGGTISWVGGREDLPGPETELAHRVVDVGGGWMTPGLIDCHTHIVYGGERSEEFELRLQGVSYEEIARRGGGILSTVRATREADEEDLAEAAAGRVRDLLAEGVTTIEVKSGYGLDTATELKMLRVARRLGEALPVTVRTTFLGAHAVPPEYEGDADGYVELVCREMLPAVISSGLADAVDAFCERIAFTPDQVSRVFETAAGAGMPVKLHAEQLSDQGGAQLVSGYGGMSADHLEYVSRTGVRAMADSGTVAVLLPGAYYVLGETRTPPVQWFREAGVPMALSTDCNPGSSPVTSLLLMLSMGCTLFGMTPEEALAGVTREAASALGLGETHGTVEEGKVADLVVWEIHRPAALAYAIGANPCRMVVRGGEIVLRRHADRAAPMA